MTKTVLLCTVGGSHEPILASILENKPDFVYFICSGKDPATGKPGSERQITGRGNVIKEHPSDTSHKLPNIPTQAGLHEEQYKAVLVPADDLDKAFRIIRHSLREAVLKHPEARFIADYTGGAKSMTAALVLAVVEDEAVDLRLVTGIRSDLASVASGMEGVEQVNVETIRAQRAVARSLDTWQWFAYGEAERELADIKPRDPALAGKVRILRDISKAFDEWDRFDHQSAFRIINIYRAKITPAHKYLLDAIKNLNTESEYQTPARLLDLWLNAERRAAQKRFDDAVARLYRLLEWTAQWVLHTHLRIDTADIPPDKIPKDVSIQLNRKGRCQAGLTVAWQLIGHWLPNTDAGRFSLGKLAELQAHVDLRNHSILAHGYKPVDEMNWHCFKTWVEGDFLTLLQQEAEQAGLRSLPLQLPQEAWPDIELSYS